MRGRRVRGGGGSERGMGEGERVSDLAEVTLLNSFTAFFCAAEL